MWDSWLGHPQRRDLPKYPAGERRDGIWAAVTYSGGFLRDVRLSASRGMEANRNPDSLGRSGRDRGIFRSRSDRQRAGSIADRSLFGDHDRAALDEKRQVVRGGQWIERSRRGPVHWSDGWLRIHDRQRSRAFDDALSPCHANA